MASQVMPVPVADPEPAVYRVVIHTMDGQTLYLYGLSAIESAEWDTDPELASCYGWHRAQLLAARFGGKVQRIR